MKENVVYKITNTENNHRYVGSTTAGLRVRRGKHLWELKNNIHHNRHLQRAYNLYGKDKFVFEILEHVADVNTLLAREGHWTDILKPEYNIDLKHSALSHIGMKRTEETRRRISESQKGKKERPEVVERLRLRMLGRRLTEDQKRKQIESMKKSEKVKANLEKIRKERLGTKYSEEHCNNISKALTGRKLSKEHVESIRKALTGKTQSKELVDRRIEPLHKPILQLDREGNLVAEWKSATVAASALNFNRKSIYRCLWNEYGRKSYKGFGWKYKNESS